MKIKTTNHSRYGRSCAAMTLVEVMVSAGLASLLFATLALLWAHGARSVLAMTNYTELDRSSKYALDLMSRDIRQAKAMTSFATTNIAMTNDSAAYSYNYNGVAKTLTRTYAGSSRVLLTECDNLAFGIYNRVPTNNFDFRATTDVTQAKLVDVNWKCSRKIKGQKVNTESIQTAKIVMRN